MASTTTFIRDGPYSIRSASNNTYLTRGSTNSVVAQPRLSNNNASQLWTLSRGTDGDYEIRSSAVPGEALRVNLNQLVCSATGRRVTWNIEPRGSGAYVIGNAANANAIQLPNRSSPVAVVPRTNGLNGARQRWILEPDPLNSQSILNSLHGFWRVTWGTHPAHEGLLALQVSNGVAQGGGHDTLGRRYTCVVRHVSGDRLHFNFSLILGSASPLTYEATISADRRIITGIMSIRYTRIS